MPFGFGGKSLEEQLSDLGGGRQAEAEVLSSQPTKHFEASCGHELNGRSWILGVRVRPSGEAPFEAELRASLKAMACHGWAIGSVCCLTPAITHGCRKRSSGPRNLGRSLLGEGERSPATSGLVPAFRALRQ